jgi:hypothetical protein
MVYRFGGGDEHAVVDAVLEPVVIDLPLGEVGRPLRVEIVGRTEAVTPAGSLILALRRSAIDAELKARKDALRAFLDQVMLSASGVSDGRPHAALVCTAGEAAGSSRIRLAPLSRDEARAWLAMVAADLLGRAHGYLLPCEAVLLRGRSTEDVAPFVEKVVRGERHSSVYGPVRHPERFAPPPEAEAREMIDRRFGPFFAREGT